MCCLVTVFEDNHLVANLHKDGPVTLWTVQHESNGGDMSWSVKIHRYEFEV